MDADFVFDGDVASGLSAGRENGHARQLRVGRQAGFGAQRTGARLAPVAKGVGHTPSGAKAGFDAHRADADHQTDDGHAGLGRLLAEQRFHIPGRGLQADRRQAREAGRHRRPTWNWHIAVISTGAHHERLAALFVAFGKAVLPAIGLHQVVRLQHRHQRRVVHHVKPLRFEARHRGRVGGVGGRLEVGRGQTGQGGFDDVR
ncbi:MAG: hypothetical protein Q8N44_16815 [Rubrivivax sp.]|nr:hypothetical protein [Rubrivivax sp.]